MRPNQLPNRTSAHAVDSEPRVSNRAPMERKVVLKFHDFGGFSIEYSANISTSGMFVRTTSPKPVGSIFIFEIWLGDERKLVHGLGEVVWIRDKEESPDRPAGMGVSYLKLDDESRVAIGRIVEHHLLEESGASTDSSWDAEGSDGEDLEGGSLRPVPSDEPRSGELLVLDENDLQLDDPLGPTMESGVIGSRPRQDGSSGRSRVALWLVLLLAVAGGVGYLWYSGGLQPLGPWLESLM